MKKASWLALIIVGGMMAVTLVSICVGIVRSARVSPDAEAYVAQVVEQICRSWEATTLLAHASPELGSSISTEQAGVVLRRLGERLGPMIGHGTPAGGVVVRYSTQQGRRTEGSYQVHIQCSRGLAKCVVRVVRLGDRWWISQFAVKCDNVTEVLGGS
jgi:hypothetical protein